MRVLGVDLGSKRIGIAVSDRSGTIASPLTVLARSGDVGADHRRIADLVVEEEAVCVVVGLPLNMNGSEGPRAEASRKFAEQLTSALGLPVELWDERLSTMAATRTLLEADVSRAKRKEVIDQVAAQFILQGWLDARQPPYDPSDYDDYDQGT